jgi:AcrR family transcriptional regulator
MRPPSNTTNSGEAAAKPQLTPADWIRAATEVLVQNGIDAVRVDVLAKTMGVTRGSFYWHFRDREDLLMRVLKAWHDQATDDLINRFERSGASAAALLSGLMSLPLRGEAAVRSASIELAVRAWARRDEIARKVVDEVDAKRLAYTSQCFIALGFGFQDARHRAFALYSYVIGEALLYNQSTPEQRQERQKSMAELLLKPPFSHNESS